MVAIGYPRFFPSTGGFLSGRDCLKLALTFTHEDRIWINEIIDLVNSKINSSALEKGIQYNPVDWGGHEICGTSGEDWLNHITWRDTTERADQSGWKRTGEASLHPNYTGHDKGYAKDLDNVLGHGRSAGIRLSLQPRG